MKIKVVLIFLCVFANIDILKAQTHSVSGIVVSSEDGGALAGASVLVLNTYLGAITDIDGKFSISNIPSSSKTLRVSFVGMQSQDIPIQPGIIKVVLIPITEMLEEVIVTAMGISRSKKALGYAASEVKGDEMRKSRGGVNNPVNALQGKVAGLHISSSSGSIGGSSKILIRGVNSISGNNQPLFVIDGVPIEGGDFNSIDTQRGNGGYDYGSSVQDINLDDVESISVLKGASASALYGSRAGNGVIIITTKKGEKKEGLGISFTSSVGFEMINKLPKLQKTYGGGTDSKFTPITINGITYNYPSYDDDMSWGPRLDGQDIISWYDLAKWEAGGKIGNPTTSKWQTPAHDFEHFFETGFSFTNNLSVSQATENAAMRLSYTNTDQKGYMPNSSLKKNAVSVAGNITSHNKKLESFINANYTNTLVKGRAETGYAENNVMSQFVQFGHRQLDIVQTKNLYIMPDGTQASWNRVAWNNPTPNYVNNPYWSRYMNYQNDSRNRIYGNIGASYQIIPELKFQYKINLDFFADKQYERTAIGSHGQSKYKESSRQQYELNHEFMLIFAKQLGDFSLNANMGANIMVSSHKYIYGQTVGGLAIPLFYSLGNSISQPISYNYAREKGIYSVFANVSAGWKSMLYMEATLRNDKSSTLPKNNNSYTYPSVTASFIFSELLKNKTPWISLGKLRAGISKIGNDTDPYQIIATYSQYTNVDPTTPGYLLPNIFNNENLKPESTTSYEVGLEMSFLHNRFGFDIAYYTTETKDQIIPLSVSGTTGYLYKIVNSGVIDNKGVEFSIHVKPIRTKGFTWETSLVLSSNKNKVKELIDGVDYYKIASARHKVEIGALKNEVFGVIMGTNYVFDKNGNKMIDPKTGLYRSTDGNENIGSIYPDLTGGWVNTFKIGNLDLSILLDFSKGGHYFATSYMLGMYSGMMEESAANNIRENGILLDGVIDENGTRNTTVASGRMYSKDFYTGPAAQSIFKSDYIKLREINIGYTIPIKIGFVKHLRVSVYGRNLCAWGPDRKHFDSEMIVKGSGNIQGIEGGVTPSVATFGASINIKF